MKKTVHTIGQGPGADYTSLASWESGVQGAPTDLQVAIVDEHVIEHPLAAIREIAPYSTTPALFVSQAGHLLAFVRAGDIEVLATEGEGAPSTQDVDQAIDGFIEERFGIERSETHVEVRAVVRGAAEALARIIADDPAALDSIEWRQLEQVMAEVFEKLGFSVELTAPSKDGGKDLILSCRVSTGTRTYVVEIKHWVSGKRVGENVVRQVLQIVVRGGRGGGLILATSGFTGGAKDALVSIESRRVHGGERDSIFTLCRMYASGEGKLLEPEEVWASLTQGHPRDA